MEKETTQAQAIRRIEGMLAQAEDAAKRGNEAERDIWLDKAAALQLKYAIDEAMLASQGKATEGIVHGEFCRESNSPLIKAKRELITSLAVLFRGKAVLCGAYKRDANGQVRRGKGGQPLWDGRAYVRVYAYESDLNFIRVMYASLLLQMQSMMANDEKVASRNQPIQGWRVSYAHAWVNRVYNRMLTDKKFQEREVRQDGPPGTALALRNRQSEVEKHFESLYTKTRKSTYKIHDTNEAGRAAGWVAGGKADLGSNKVASANQPQIGS